jgi:hypothetical protein
MIQCELALPPSSGDGLHYTLLAVLFLFVYCGMTRLIKDQWRDHVDMDIEVP